MEKMGKKNLKRAGNPVAHARTQGLNITNFGPCGKYGSRPSNGTTLDRYIHRRQIPVTILNIGRGRRREHPKVTSEGVT